jgi:hypothetical protein
VEATPKMMMMVMTIVYKYIWQTSQGRQVISRRRKGEKKGF